MTRKEFCSHMDHSCLGWICSRETVDRFCDEALEYGFATVCVNPDQVAYCVSRLGGRVGVSCVVGFPQGFHSTAIKIAEGLEAIDNGATDLDVVTNLSWLRDGRDDLIRAEYEAFVKAVRAKKPDTVIKIIMYAPYGPADCLTEDETRRVAGMIVASGADYIKFCCDPKIIKALVGDSIKMKFSGSYTLDIVMDALKTGCSRIGEESVPGWLQECGDDYWDK
ncbi:MAG: hypothetical protein P4M02_12000 [Clostridia bacterium]|nr:hypothetical protein [Clostridia bacterium]